MEYIEQQQEAEEYAAYLDQLEYEERSFDVFCDLCHSEARATQKELKLRGWQLGGGGAFCPRHLGA